MLKYSIICCSLLLILASGASAEIYKWTDENGNVHYGDKPGQTQSEKVEIDTENNPGNPEPGMTDRLETQQKMLQIYEEERMEKEQQRIQAARKKEETRKKCGQLKDYHRNLKQATRLYVLDDDGNRKYLNDASHQKEIQEIEALLEKNCH